MAFVYISENAIKIVDNGSKYYFSKKYYDYEYDWTYDYGVFTIKVFLKSNPEKIVFEKNDEDMRDYNEVFFRNDSYEKQSWFKVFYITLKNLISKKG